MKTMNKRWTLVAVLLAAVSTGAQAADQDCDGYEPNSAVLPAGKGCPKVGNTIKYDPDCARLNGCADQRPGRATPQANAPQQLGATPKRKEIGLLLPAVQAAPEAPGRPAAMSAGRNPGQAADTSCESVSACNDMIATCLSMGGNVTPTEYDPQTGAPSGATCFSPGS